MKKIKLTDEDKFFDNVLNRKLKNKTFKDAYEAEGLRLQLAHELYEARRKRHISQKKLANKLKMPQQQISRIEMGNQNITLDTLSRITSALNVRADVKLKLM